MGIRTLTTDTSPFALKTWESALLNKAKKTDLVPVLGASRLAEFVDLAGCRSKYLAVLDGAFTWKQRRCVFTIGAFNPRFDCERQ